MSQPPNRDLVELQTLHDRFIAADRAGDAEALVSLLADDVVILHPQCGVIEGKSAAAAFMRQVLSEVHQEFDKEAQYTTVERQVSGTLACERGHFSQTLAPKSGGDPVVEDGMYLWVYMQQQSGEWKLARIAGTITTPEEC
jgi:uncharacterized protein (TIGR02246 family)